MNHTILGRLRGSLRDGRDHGEESDHCREPLAGVVVRIYRADGADTTRILDAATAKCRTDRLLVEATTYPDGSFAATLPEDRYDGGALDIDVRCHTVPGLKCQDEPREPVQVHVTTLRPEWAGEPYLEVSVDYILPASTWLQVRARFGAWVICGRVVERESRETVAGAVVRAFDTDWLQDDPLGAATTDNHGYFRLDYIDRDFKRTPLSPLVHLELIGGPDLYFHVESYTGTAVLDESRSAGRTPGRENVDPYVCVELEVTGPASPPYPRDPKWDDRREHEVRTSFMNGRAPIARVGDVYFRPWELLLSAKAADLLRTELTERYRASLYVPDPDDCHDWRTHNEGTPASHRDVNARLAEAGIDLQLYVVSRTVSRTGVFEVVKTLRSRFPGLAGDREFGVHLNHVMFAEPFYQGGPDGDPEPCPQPEWPPGGTAPPGVDVAVLDTGVWVKWSTVHPALAGHVRPDSDDKDLLDEQSPPGLDTCAGHGVFICGLIHRIDSTLRVDPGRVLNSVGDGDDAMVAAELAQTVAQVVNLSLGCHTMDAAAAPATAAAINNLVGKDVALVAAAGNNHDGGTEQPFWPAAMQDVIAVGSWDSTLGLPARRATTSNRGAWVDVWAPGVRRVSSYVVGWPSSGNGGPFDGWARWSGTSFAAPHVAAKIAILQRLTPGLTARQVAAAMLGPNGLPDSPWDGNSGRKAKLYPDEGRTG